ncbi:MAG TPA: hypothetical protein VF458_18210 [Ktedonobacteraceae bacterium]
MNQFSSIRKLDQAILYTLELASSLSVLLLAFGLIASMANVLTKGSFFQTISLCNAYGHGRNVLRLMPELQEPSFFGCPRGHSAPPEGRRRPVGQKEAQVRPLLQKKAAAYMVQDQLKSSQALIGLGMSLLFDLALGRHIADGGHHMQALFNPKRPQANLDGKVTTICVELEVGRKAIITSQGFAKVLCEAPWG